MRLQETKHLIIKLLQKRSDVPKRGRLTFAIFFEKCKCKGIKKTDCLKKFAIKYKIRQVSRKD